jgi:hypothetical protein
MGSPVDVPSIRPIEQPSSAPKARWFEITDDLPQGEEYA